MMTKLKSFGLAVILVFWTSITIKAQGYSDSDIQKIGNDRDSSKDRENLTVKSSSSTRADDVSLIFVGQSDSNSLDGVRPSGIYKITRDGHESSFSDVNLQTFYYVHDRSGSKRFDFGSHKRSFVYLITLRNVDLDALRDIRSDRNSDYRWTNANTNRKYGRNDEWRSGCGSGKYRGLAYVNKEIKSYNKGIQIAAVMYDDNPTNIGIYRSRTSNTKIMNVLESWRQGDDAMTIGMKTTDGSRTDELHFRGTECVRGNGENVLASFTLKPDVGGDGNEDWLIDNCDRESGWSSSNTKSISSNYKEGSGSLKSIGSGTDDFKRTFATTNGQDATALEFWYYIDNPSRFDSSNQVELGSDGRPDNREYNWRIDKSTLSSGWNLIKLDFEDANITGGTPDKTRLNWFRLYRRKNGSTTSRIDFIRLTNNNNNNRLNIQSQVDLDSKLRNEYQLYPNPSEGGVHLLIPNRGNNGNAMVSIINVMGQVVYTKELKGLRDGINQITMDIQLSPAVYLVEIRGKESRGVLRLVIKE